MIYLTMLCCKISSCPVDLLLLLLLNLLNLC